MTITVSISCNNYIHMTITRHMDVAITRNRYRNRHMDVAIRRNRYSNRHMDVLHPYDDYCIYFV
jgi:hypothetical protein